MPKYGDFTDVANILDEYSLEIQEGIENEAESISKAAATDLRQTKGTYEIRTGKYNKGWRVKTEKGKFSINCIVHNTKYQLTHLLEKGHITRNGGRTRAFPHIRPVEKKYVSKYIKNVETLIKNGGKNA